MFVRLNIGLRPDEKRALEGLAIQERRRVEAQAAWIIRKELERLGLLNINQIQQISKEVINDQPNR